MDARPETRIWLESYYEAADSLQFERLAAFFTPDVVGRYPNGHVIRGRDAVIERFQRNLTSLERVSHRVLSAWEEDELVIYELSVRYWLHDGDVITRPAAAILSTDGTLIREQRIFADPTGIWKPVAPSSSAPQPDAPSAAR